MRPIPGAYAIEVRGAEKYRTSVTPVSNSCSSHNYAMDDTVTVNTAVEAALRSRFPDASATADGTAGRIVVDLTEVDNHLMCGMSEFMSGNCSGESRLLVTATVSRSGSQPVTVKARGEGLVRGDAGGSCEKAGAVLSKSTAMAVNHALNNLVTAPEFDGL